MHYYEKNFSLNEAKKILVKNYHNTYIGIIPIINDKKKEIEFICKKINIKYKKNFVFY